MSQACLQELMKKVSSSTLQLTPHPVRINVIRVIDLIVITIIYTVSEDLFEPTSNSLNFGGSYSTFKVCYETTFNFDVDNICQHFNCSAIQLESTLTKVNETARVYINRVNAVVVIEPPERCNCTNEPPTLSHSNGNNAITIAATIPSILIVVAIVVILLVFIVLCYRKDKKINLNE